MLDSPWPRRAEIALASILSAGIFSVGVFSTGLAQAKTKDFNRYAKMIKQLDLQLD